jgi:hypothetical protein
MNHQEAAAVINNVTETAQADEKTENIPVAEAPVPVSPEKNTEEVDKW